MIRSVTRRYPPARQHRALTQRTRTAMNACPRPFRRLLSTVALSGVASIAVAASVASAVTPAACTASSGATVPAVVELYTSEGCDSCPPADRWFSGLKADAASGKVLPLAFHVD